ncbi:homologous-pairing protein 2 homolog [Arctopsyche grandis]|uniref:homologous-pairing protein 2 homolog n=1 Tax=Arctopsyche grandis TaxID=121162 RepID=UPI00406D74DB
MAEEAVQKYLETTNRPYSANDIVLNMHKQWGKTGVQRALDNLVAANIVLEKTYGKQKVYVIKQDPNDCPTEEELKGLDRNIAQSTQELREVEDTVKKLEGELKSLTGAMTISQAKKEIAIVQKEIEDLEVRLDTLSKNSVPISPEKMKKVKEDSEKVNKEYRKRKRICMDILNTVLETYPKPKKALLEEVGIETDEDAEFTFENVNV